MMSQSIWSCDLTILQGGDGLTLFTVFTVSNIIGGLHLELVGGEWLESAEKRQLNECYCISQILSNVA